MIGRVRRHRACLLAGPVWLITGCDDEARWYQDVQEARLAPHLYFGPAWFVRDPAGWSPLGWYPYGFPGPERRPEAGRGPGAGAGRRMSSRSVTPLSVLRSRTSVKRANMSSIRALLAST